MKKIEQNNSPYFILEVFLTFAIPISYFMVRIFSGDFIPYIETVFLLTLSSAFSAFFSNIYKFDNDYKAIIQSYPFIIGIIGIVVTLFFDNFSFNFSSYYIQIPFTFIILILAIRFIYSQKKEDYIIFKNQKEESNQLHIECKNHKKEIANLKKEAGLSRINLTFETLDIPNEERLTLIDMIKGVTNTDELPQKNSVGDKTIRT